MLMTILSCNQLDSQSWAEILEESKLYGVSIGSDPSFRAPLEDAGQIKDAIFGLM